METCDDCGFASVQVDREEIAARSTAAAQQIASVIEAIEQQQLDSIVQYGFPGPLPRPSCGWHSKRCTSLNIILLISPRILERTDG